jgi:hypothetical protein
MYCAVSTLEFVAKLYGLLPLDSFPLQSNPANQKKGFGERDLQDALGLQGWDKFYDVQSALEIIEKETIEGRFLGVSLLVFGANQKIEGYHIFVAARLDGLPILVDPADGQVKVRAKEDLAKILEYNSRMNPERKTIHLLYLNRK